MNVCVVIPIYNHKDTIEGVVKGLSPLGLSCLVVDDGSDAATRAVLDALPTRYPWVEVVRRSRNGGRGAALRDGYRAAAGRGFSHALQIDADGQHDPADARALVAAARTDPGAVVLGRPVFDASAPRSRLYGRRLSQGVVWAYTGSRAIQDPLCGFRCFPLDATLRVLDNHYLGSRMDFDPEIVVRLAWYGLRVINVPTRVRYFADGLSHFRFGRDNVLIARAYGRLFLACVTGRRTARPRRRR